MYWFSAVTKHYMPSKDPLYALLGKEDLSSRPTFSSTVFKHNCFPLHAYYKQIWVVKNVINLCVVQENPSSLLIIFFWRQCVSSALSFSPLCCLSSPQHSTSAAGECDSHVQSQIALAVINHRCICVQALQTDYKYPYISTLLYYLKKYISLFKFLQSWWEKNCRLSLCSLWPHLLY